MHSSSSSQSLATFVHVSPSFLHSSHLVILSHLGLFTHVSFPSWSVPQESSVQGSLSSHFHFFSHWSELLQLNSQQAVLVPQFCGFSHWPVVELHESLVQSLPSSQSLFCSWQSGGVPAQTWQLLGAGLQPDDTTTQTRAMGGYGIAHLFAAWELDRDWFVEGRVNNLFDRVYENAWAYAVPRRELLVGLRYAPK